MNKEILGIITGSSLLLKILSGDISYADQDLKSNDSISKKVIVENVVEEDYYPCPKDVNVVKAYLSSFCEQYEQIRGTEEAKIKNIVTNMADQKGAGKFSKEIKKAYDFDEKGRNSVEEYLKSFVINSECDTEDLSSRIDYFYETYNEVAGIASDVREKYLRGVSTNKQKDMADLQIMSHYTNVSAKLIVMLERAIKVANGELERSVVDDILKINAKDIMVIPSLNERAKYFLIKNFKEIDDGGEAYKGWMTDLYNSSELLKKVCKSSDEFISTYNEFYEKMNSQLKDDPVRNMFEHLNK